MDADNANSSELEAVRQQFEHWRANRKNSRSRIPDELWQAAKDLSATYSINKVAKTLRLSYEDLKKRIHLHHDLSSTDKTSSPFVELKWNPSSMQSECVIEMQHPTGAKMKMCFRGETNLDLLELGKAFWSSKF